MLMGEQISYGALIGLTVGASALHVPMEVNMLVSTACCIYLGSFKSLHLKKNNETAEGDDIIEGETMTTDDVKMFPVYGSCALFGLFCAFKFLPPGMVNLVLSFYMGTVAVMCLGQMFDQSVREMLAKKEYKFDFTLPYFGKQLVEFTWSLVVSLALGTVVVGFYFYTKTGPLAAYNYMLNNLIGVSFSMQGIELMSLGTYLNGVILLSGLFFYDIFWVFATPVMVSVAKNVDMPIKLLFPRTFVSDWSMSCAAKAAADSVATCAANAVCNERMEELFQLDKAPAKISLACEGLLDADLEMCTATFQQVYMGCTRQMSMLGLGDIVIPGIVIALMLRFDAHQAGYTASPEDLKSKKVKTSSVGIHFSKPYFTAIMVSYVLGLVTTIVCMMFFDAAQPALLYLVPACLASTYLTACWRRETSDLWAFNEEAAEEGAAEETKKES